MKRTIEKEICELDINHATPEEAAAKISSGKAAYLVGHKEFGERLEIRFIVKERGDSDYWGEMHLFSVRQESDAEEAEREAADKAFLDAHERAEYERLRAKFEKQEQAIRDAI